MRKKEGEIFMAKKAFDFVPVADLPKKPRNESVTEIRGGYYSVVGLTYMKDLFEENSEYIDVFKFAGGTQRLLDRTLVKKKIDLCHDYDILVSTGGFTERVLVTMNKSGKLAMVPNPLETFEKYLDEARALGFDIVEISDGLIKGKIDLDTRLEMTRIAKKYGIRAKPEVSAAYGIKMGEEVNVDPKKLISEAREFLKNGAWKIMIESEGITENVGDESRWKKDVIFELVKNLDIKKLMFEGADPEVFQWYIRNFGTGVNFFIDHSQITELTLARRKVWVKKATWDSWW
jgi:phosphosulfolactate synthase (CoM biosynthesis protein A)